jgi:hypothetical protein
MSIDNLDTIDGTALDTETGELVLLISDHFNWSNEQLHLSILQDKINAYFRYVSSGQVYEMYPEAKKGGIRIDCICSFPAPPSTDWFVEEVRKAAAPLKVGFTFKVLPEEYMAQDAKQ